LTFPVESDGVFPFIPLDDEDTKKLGMNTKLIILTLALGTSLCAQNAQNQNLPPDEQRPAPRQGPSPAETEALTEAQKAQAKAILSKYNPMTLTAEQAKAIHEAFRQAGLRGGPAMADTIKAAGFDPDRLRDLAPPPDRGPGIDGGNGQPPPRREGDRAQGADDHRDRPDQGPRGQQGQYSIEQAVSDRAQLNTIAFDGLAFLTGDLGSCTFLPPGKAADFFGFQYMRDVDQNELGHNTSFVPRAANNVLHILTADQKAQLVALAKEQEKLLAELGYKRFPLIKAFCRQLTGDLPAGKTALDREAVMQYTAGIFEIDGLLSYRRAKVVGDIVRSLTAEQKAYLGKMVFNNSSTWPELQDQVDKRSLSHAAHVAVMTYASEMFSWYAGSVDADVYFCPERHATYFGSFYMKDIPAMGNANFSISTSLTGDSGEAFLDALTDTQRPLITGLVDLQRKDLDEIVAVRRAISVELRRFMKEASVDQTKVLALAKRYGELDGEISYFYAMRFAEVNKTLTPEQKKVLLKLRNLDAQYTCKGAYLYSQPIAMPEIRNTDFLFGSAAPTVPIQPAAAAVPVATVPSSSTAFALRSPAVENGGRLPQEYTGDGASATLPLEWSAPPEGTQSYALLMHHIDPEGKTKWYWTLYNIPASVRSLPKNVEGIGILGNNSINGKVGYAPPHSKGPGDKTYVLTVYALAEPLQLTLPPSQVTRDVLLAAMQGKVLARSELQVVYARGTASSEPRQRPEARRSVRESRARN
jgi:phosphatidylethanolamine-binding protein (PEBP) family uncharacterized protein/Spy/CpxP family protein refolding chaperone